MQIFKAEYVSISDGAKKMHSLCMKAKEEIEGLSEEITSMSIFWDGTANEEFIMNVGGDLMGALTFIFKLDALASFVTHACEEYQDVERFIHTKIEEL